MESKKIFQKDSSQEKSSNDRIIYDDDVSEKAEYFVQHFCNSSEAVIELEMKNTFSKYSNDVITSCALGVECDSLKDEANIFYKMGSSISSPRLGSVLRRLLTALFPRVCEVNSIESEKVY